MSSPGDWLNPETTAKLLDLLRSPAGALAFVPLYALWVTLLLPGVWASMLAGALYGTWWGSLIVFVGACLGAEAAFLLGRTWLRNWARRRLAAVPKLLAIEQAWHTIERQFGAHRGWSMERGDGGGTHEMSDAVARVWATWNCWATEVQRRTTVRGSVIASAIEQRIALDGINVDLYRTAARIWHRCVRDAPPARPLQGQAIGGKPDF